jgi:pheromone a factor receptor
MALYAFYKRRRNHMQLISGYKGGQYLRLMAISAVEMLGVVPLGTFYIVSNAKSGVSPWKGWASMHSHYSEVEQVAGFTWKNVPKMATGLEMFRWSLVACAFLFFALYGFAVEAREQYYRLYKLLTRRIGTSSSGSHEAPHAYVVRSLCYLRPDSLGLVHIIIILQYSTSPLCEEKRWRHES